MNQDSVSLGLHNLYLVRNVAELRQSKLSNRGVSLNQDCNSSGIHSLYLVSSVGEFR